MEFKVNIKGRVKNFPLQENTPLVPVFEAIVNSIQSIDDALKTNKDFKGKISIHFKRDDQLISDNLGPINEVIIIDNGLGFNKKNFTSFMESDTANKIEIGGKGVGRFSWLKAFNSAKIQSYFKDDKGTFYREFDFNLNTTRIQDIATECKNKEVIKTSVALSGLKESFKKQMPRQLNVLAVKIISHCFNYFFNPECPEITVSDDEEVISLNKLFKDKVEKINEENFAILENDFKIINLKVESSIIKTHELMLTANNRAVKEFNLADIIVDINALRIDEKYLYLGIISSKYLDDNVDMNRLSFTTIPDKITSMADSEIISIERIVLNSSQKIELLLKDLLEPIIKEKEKRIENYINFNSPQYRHLLKYKSEEIKKIKPGLTNEKLDSELYKIKKSFEEEVKKEQKNLIQTINDRTSIEGYEEALNLVVQKISDSNKSRLADYVIHRKAIIDLFEKGMSLNDEDKYSREAFMHNLIYPMRTISEEIMHDEQNLWIIDEKLSYYFYISSDIPFNNDSKEKRADIMLFDRSIAMVEEKNEGLPYDSVVIFELKKPMRDDLPYEDPIVQVIDYMEQIKTNSLKDKKGRYIKVNDKTRFYLYVICDVSPKYKAKVKSMYNLSETVDGLGFYRMSENEYLEILSYDKILNDSKKRNQILFEKLGIN